jgi:hypothetical protein
LDQGVDLSVEFVHRAIVRQDDINVFRSIQLGIDLNYRFLVRSPFSDRAS